MHSSTLIATMAVLAIIIPVYAVKPKDVTHSIATKFLCIEQVSQQCVTVSR